MPGCILIYRFVECDNVFSRGACLYVMGRRHNIAAVFRQYVQPSYHLVFYFSRIPERKQLLDIDSSMKRYSAAVFLLKFFRFHIFGSGLYRVQYINSYINQVINDWIYRTA